MLAARTKLGDELAEAATALAAGTIVVLLGDESEGAHRAGGLLLAAETATSSRVARMVRDGTGYLRVAVADTLADRLDLPLMWGVERPAPAGHYCVSVDASRGLTTGISATDRAHTIRLLAHPATVPRDLARPGHVVPLRVKGVGPYTFGDAAVDLARLAGLAPAVVFSELVSRSDPIQVAGTPELVRWAAAQGAVTVRLRQLERAARAR
jgi:3,4-dihydroxy 2-butanone 4-phosphate synthase/GTP cyclohydrolase II